MKVFHREIPEKAIAAVTVEMERRGSFRMTTVATLLKQQGLDDGGVWLSLRTAQRLVDKLKRDGVVEYLGRQHSYSWRWKKER